MKQHKKARPAKVRKNKPRQVKILYLSLTRIGGVRKLTTMND